MQKLLFGILGLVLAITITSCDKDEIAPEEEIQSTMIAEDESSVEYLIDDTEEFEDAVISLRNPEDPCLVITWLNPKGTFPNTVTLDFGDGCVGPNGHVRAGKIIITQTERMFEEGATRTTSFDNFSIDGILFQGSKVLENGGFDAEGNVTFIRLVNIALTFPNGKTVTWEAEYVRTQVAGGDTQNHWDDVFEITGYTSGVNRNGIAFSTVITDPLVKPRNCRWVIDGTLEITWDDKTRTIDFGFPSVECDNLAQVTFPNGLTKVIRIHKRWW